MAELIVSVSGVRGIIGETLTPEIALRFGQALGYFLRQNAASAPVNVALGRDSRISGPMLAGAMAAGLLSTGVNVTELGIATTPTIALMGRFLKAQAAVVITASHNPGQYNGIKFLRHDGIAMPAEAIAQLHQLFQTEPFACQSVENLGLLTTDSRSHAHHVQTVLAHIDAKPIAANRYKVVLDSINGAGCIASPMLLGKLGAELIHINASADGRFAHTPEPTKDNLTGLCHEVKARRAHVGFAQDPDADRLAIVDEHGSYIGEEYTLALATLARLSVKPGAVVANLSTSRLVDDIAARHNCRVLRTPVGEANVAARMMAENAVIGGEGNGGVIDLRIGPVRDSLLGMALILDLLARTNKTVSQLVADLPRYAMIKEKFTCTRAQADALVARAKTAFSDGKVDTQDGARIDWPQGWVHVRPSNTEPIARIIAESTDEATARELIARVERLRSDT